MAEQDSLGEVLYLGRLFDPGFEVAEDPLDGGGGEESGELDLSRDDDFIRCITVVPVVSLEGERWHGAKIRVQNSRDLIIRDTEARCGEDNPVKGLRINGRRNARSKCSDSLSLEVLFLSNLKTLGQGLAWGGHNGLRLPDHNMAMVAKVLALRRQTKIISKEVQELAMAVRHRIESMALLFEILTQVAESSFLVISPTLHLPVELESILGKRNMLVGVIIWIDVECIGQPAVTFQACAFIIALERLIGVGI